jgi:CRP/FNR family transcriptional regulator, cyclic AMP receptor protein
MSPRAGSGGSDLPTIGRDEVALLDRVPLLAGLSKRQLRKLADVASRVEYTRGSMVVTAGAPSGVAFFVIVSGTAAVERGGRRIAFLGGGEFFGELSLLDGRRRSASVVAETPLVVIRLGRDAFRDLVASDPDIPFQIMEVLADRIRALEETLDEAGLAVPEPNGRAVTDETDEVRRSTPETPGGTDGPR